MEVTCDLVKGPVYLAGEEVTCLITFTNTNPGGPGMVLAWASAQLNCFCTVSDSKIAILDKEVTRKSSNPVTSFQPCAGEAGMSVLSSTTKILVCDLSLAPGERRVVTYTELVPLTSPPTYRGHSIKYSYKITIGTQLLNCQTAMLRVPIRVLSISGFNPNSAGLPVDKAKGEEAPGPNNPFLDDEEDTETPADLIMQNIQDITSKRNASHFNIANQKGKVCRFCLFKRNYRLGEDIVGTFDFTLGTLPCVQYSVSLQLVETVEPSYKVKQDQTDKVVTHSKHHEVCLGFSHSHMVLPIPLQLAPSFTTPVCSVNYNLHFEFVISTDGIECQPVPEEEGGSEWQGPVRLDIETMVWDLPIKIFPTYPNHAAQSCQLESRHVTTVYKDQ